MLPFAKKCAYLRKNTSGKWSLAKKTFTSFTCCTFSETRVLFSLAGRKRDQLKQGKLWRMALAVVSRRAAASAVTAGGRISQLTPCSACFKSTVPTRGHTSEADTVEQVQNGNGNGNGHGNGNGARAR